MAKKSRVLLSGVMLVLVASWWLSPDVQAQEPCEPNLQFLRYKGFANDSPFAPGQEFRVTFSVKNNSECRLDREYEIALIDGNNSIGVLTQVNPQLDFAPEQEGDVNLDLIAPTTIGVHENVWQLVQQSTPEERFGDRLVVRIRVVAAPIAETAQAPNPSTTLTPLPPPIDTSVGSTTINESRPREMQDFLLPGIGVLAVLFLLLTFWAFRLWRRGKEAAGDPDSGTNQIIAPVPQAAQLTSAALVDPLLLHDPTLLGRGEAMDSKFTADVPGLASVELEHARIVKRNNRWLLQDGIEENRPSEQGVFVNGKRARVIYLQDGDKICLGEVEFIFREPPSGAKQ